VIGISSLATDHLLVPQVLAALREAGLGHVKVVVGGIVPDDEVADLLRAGVSHVFHPGSAREEIVATVRRLAEDARAAA
jgi:methylmalonyl-CoA mutase C-terminal domain/subunit